MKCLPKTFIAAILHRPEPVCQAADGIYPVLTKLFFRAIIKIETGNIIKIKRAFPAIIRKL